MANICEKNRKAVILKGLRVASELTDYAVKWVFIPNIVVESFFRIKSLKIWQVECPTLPLPSLKNRING